jgi:hypothetical protein
MSQTKSKKNGSKNGRRKPTPQLGDILGEKKGSAPTADQIADSIEAQVKEMQGVADILRGKVAS